jgi:hypothetical protein
MDLDVEVEAGLALDVGAQQAGRTPLPQHLLQVLQQEAVLAAQVDEARRAPTAQAAKVMPSNTRSHGGAAAPGP